MSPCASWLCYSLTVACLLKAYDLRERRLEFHLDYPHDQPPVQQQDKVRVAKQEQPNTNPLIPCPQAFFTDTCLEALSTTTVLYCNSSPVWSFFIVHQHFASNYSSSTVSSFPPSLFQFMVCTYIYMWVMWLWEGAIGVSPVDLEHGI